MRTVAIAVAAVGRGQEEDGFGQVELGRDGLHRRAVEPAGVGEDRQRIAAERSVGENVEGEEGIRWHRLSPSLPSCTPAQP